MRFAVPVNAADEVAALVGAGAGELYVGYQGAWWVERYGDHDSASRRQGRANLSTRSELEAVARAARAHGVPVWLALNSRYTEPQLDCLVQLVSDFEAMGGAGVIASDLGLLWRLREGCGFARCLSILAVAQNAATLRAFAQLGVSRVVVPRFMGPREAGSLLRAVPGMEGEAMAFFDKCPWVDGYCRHRHGVTYAPRDAAEDFDGVPPLFTFDTTYQVHACLGRACTYLDSYPCAACHLCEFEQAGVSVAKLGGRGRPLDERLRALRFLRAAEGLQSDEERQALYRATFGRACACYYGQATQRREALEPVEEPPGLGAGFALGSQTDYEEYARALDRLVRGDVRDSPGVTLLIPPLDDEELEQLVEALPKLAAHDAGTLRLCANDLGTYVTLAREQRAGQFAFELVAGTLLLRVDNPHEVAHFLSASENPPRPVWGPEGEPRILTYHEPPATLVRHWQSPSLLEPSAQAALHAL